MTFDNVLLVRKVQLLKYCKFTIVLLGLAILAFQLASTVEANGRVIRFERRDAGRYEIALGTIPTRPGVGLIHLTMDVVERASSTSVPNATLTITGTGPESGPVEIGPMDVHRSSSNPAFYETNVSVDREGTWVFNISVAGELGEASAYFPVEVRNSDSLLGMATLSVMVLLLLVLGLSFRSYFKERERGGNQKSKRNP